MRELSIEKISFRLQYQSGKTLTIFYPVFLLLEIYATNIRMSNRLIMPM